MRVLAIESSCDETAAAVVRDGRWIEASVVASQIPLHQQYGGIVPEVASRAHVHALVPVVRDAIEQAEVGWDGIDLVAGTRGPGLAGSLLIFAVGGWSGTAETTLPLNMVSHNTMWVPAHLHQTVVGGTTLAFMGFAYMLVPLLVRRELWSHRLAAWQAWLYVAGMLIMTTAQSWAGALGVPRRTADTSYGGDGHAFTADGTRRAGSSVRFPTRSVSTMSTTNSAPERAARATPMPAMFIGVSQPERPSPP